MSAPGNEVKRISPPCQPDMLKNLHKLRRYVEEQEPHDYMNIVNHGHEILVMKIQII